MLKQVYIILNDKIIYHRSYAKGVDASLLINVYLSIKSEAFSRIGDEIGTHDFFESRILYLAHRDLNLLFLFVLGFSDDIETAKPLVKRLRNKFLNSFKDNIAKVDFAAKNEEIKVIVDEIQRNFRVKISIVGLSGVGKTTITRLIKSEEVPIHSKYCAKASASAKLLLIVSSIIGRINCSPYLSAYSSARTS